MAVPVKEGWGQGHPGRCPGLLTRWGRPRVAAPCGSQRFLPDLFSLKLVPLVPLFNFGTFGPYRLVSVCAPTCRPTGTLGMACGLPCAVAAAAGPQLCSPAAL